MYQAHDNPNMVTVHSGMDDPKALDRFMADPEAGRTMSEAGVKGRPELRMLHRHS